MTPFLGRRAELAIANQHLALQESTSQGRSLILQGDSGTGKSFFLKEVLLRSLKQVDHTALCIGLDLTNDDFRSAQIVTSLLKLSLLSAEPTTSSPQSVPVTHSVLEFRKRYVQRRAAGRGLLRTVAQALGSMIGVGKALSSALEDKSSPDAQSLVENELALYLRWVSKDFPVIVFVDNIQFLNLDSRLTLESILQRVNHNVRFIAVDRTIEGESELLPPIRCFSDEKRTIELGLLSEELTQQIVFATLGKNDLSAEILAGDIFTKTKGLAKDVEFCLRSYLLNPRRSSTDAAIEGLISTIDRLPVIHRQFLVVAALLDGGIKRRLAQNAVRALVRVADDSSLDAVVEELIAREYLRINGESHDRIRAGHERVVQALRELADEELQEDVRRSLIDELSKALEQGTSDENDTYLLHCLVGLQTAQELVHNLHMIVRLIRGQHRQEQFPYLVALSEELQQILPLLPESTLKKLLDAMQKSSAFDRGLQLVRRLETDYSGSADTWRLYELKFLTQLYQYSEANEVAEKLKPGPWTRVYRLNGLLALGREDEARALTDAILERPGSQEALAVVRRNTITLFDPETALQNLLRSRGFFQKSGSEFRLATVDNNSAVIYLATDQLGEAGNALERAHSRMRSIGSREIYQALINLGVRATILKQYGVAAAYFDEAALHVPRLLLLDQVKIKMNRTAVSALSGTLNTNEVARRFRGFLAEIRGVQMPRLRSALQRNLATCAEMSGKRPKETVSLRANRAGGVSHFVQIPATQGEGHPPWALMLSLHWRY